MTAYSSALTNDAGQGNFLALLKPRRRLTTWTVYSGFIYQAPFTLGDIATVEVDGVTMTSVASIGAMSASNYYYDSAAGILYLRTPGSADPGTTVAVVTYQLYFATNDEYTYKNPLDSTSGTTYWQPVISKAPMIKSTMSDVLFGYMPSQSSSMEINNAEHILEPHIYRSSFNLASIKIYHYIGPISAGAIALVYDGLMSNVIYSTGKALIDMVDRVDEFSTEYRNAGSSFYNATLFPNIDPNFIGRPIRYVYGYVKGFAPVNVDYNIDAPTTANNRTWSVIGEQTGLAEIVRTVQSGSTATQTNLNFCEGISVGDTVWLDRAVGTDEYVIVTGVTYVGTPCITHAALAGAAMAAADSARKGFVSRVDIFQAGKKYTARYGRDYTINLALAGGASGIVFSGSLEANLSLPATLSPNDSISCTVYGRVNDITMSGGAFGANDTVTNNITNPTMILYELMKTRMGMGEARMNLPAFTALRTANATEAVGFAIPQNASDSFPTYKDLALNIMQTCLLRLYLDTNVLWSVAKLAPITTTTASADSTQIYQDSFNYKFDYNELLSDVIVEYQYQEVSPEVNAPANASLQVTATSNHAKYLHKINKQKSFQSLHFRSSDAQTLANRIMFYFGERLGRILFKTRYPLFLNLINDAVAITREKLPDYPFVSGTNRTRNGAILEISKGLTEVDVTLDDQLGIQDNSASW